jgi:putative SOS response-associated peptidase YedK
MCNEIRRAVALGQIHDEFSQLRIPLRFPERLPNLAPLESIRITDPAAIVRAGIDGAELVVRRWSWPGPNRKPVYNLRSEGRSFGNSDAGGRCLVIADGFYEFTAPADAKQKRKDKWLFTKAGEPFFCIAGLWRRTEEVGEAFTLLTGPPGPDVAPYHSRQIVVLEREDWGRWLDAVVPAAEVLKPSPAGTFEVRQVA